MNRTAIAAFLCLGVAGCTTTPRETPAESAQRCEAAGIPAGSAALNRCVEDRQFRQTPRNRTAIDPMGNVIPLE